jgi:hypothetical protein
VARVALMLGILAAGLLATVAVDRALALSRTAVTTTLAAAPDEHPGGQPAGGVSIQAMTRISIPFRFSSRMPTLTQGDEFLAGGQDACTAGEELTVTFVITAPNVAVGSRGAWSQTCTGGLQDWSALVTVATRTSFVPGEAEACGVVTTHAAGYVTHSATWCELVELVALDQPFSVHCG